MKVEINGDEDSDEFQKALNDPFKMLFIKPLGSISED